MSVSWKKQFDPSQLAQYIEENRTVDGSGRVSFEPFRFTEHEVLLYSMLEFADSIPEVDARRMVHQAILKTAEKGAVTANALLAAVNRLEKDYSARPLERYVMITSLSLGQFASLRRCRFGNTIIIFEPSAPPRYQRAASHLTALARETLFADPPTDYLSTRVHVSARSEFQAAQEALETLDLARGIWNWFYNSRQLVRISGGRRSPVNKIVLGPVHTLHRPTGKLATETWWYESGYCGPVRVHNPSVDLESMYKFLARVRKRLAQCQYRQITEEAIVRYTRALDLQDWEAAFLKLWSVLELLTDSSRERSEVTVRRTAFIFEDRQSALEVLKHLRDYRNRFVHADVSDSRIETCLYQLKNFIEALLSFHLRSKYRFESIEEVARFLDLPSDRLTLESGLTMLKCAQKFRGYV